MATVSDITNTALSGLNYIDALLDKGPDWNYLTPAGNTLLYTFSVASGNESDQSGQQAFSASQQSCVRTALDYITRITGVQFVATDVGTAAQLHFANIDISGSQVTGLCSWSHSYTYNNGGNSLLSYDASAYVYLDNVEWRAQNRDLTPGGYGYETLLHELGHALGLKHPFMEAGDPANTVVLPASQDNTGNTLMSYTGSGGPHATYSQYDIAALNWIYGADGLGGALGLNSISGGRYITGTNGPDTLTGTPNDDTLEGDGGNDMINGGNGTDTVVFTNPYNSYTFSQLANGDLQVRGATDGTDTLSSIEILRFSDGSYQRAQVGADTTPPAAPKMTVSKNPAGFSMGNAPLVSGEAEANATVKIFNGSKEVGSTQADATGIWSLTLSPFAEGTNYSIYAKATDAAGNTSAASDSATFSVDVTAPTIPTGTVATTAGGNQPVFAGNAEAGTIIQLFRTSDFAEIGRTTTGADGAWHINSTPLTNGNYNVTVVSVDQADNATSSASNLVFSIATSLNSEGTVNADVFNATPGNNAIDGKDGLDLAVYNAPHSNFTVNKEVFGFTVTDKVGNSGQDTLLNVERVQFSDAWVALDVDGKGVAGQVYRLYQAAFDRTPDADGLGFWIRAMDNGWTLNQIADWFMKTKEFNDMYQSDPSKDFFITKMYEHVLHRAPEGQGYQWWLDNMDKVTRADVLAFFTDSPENQAQVIGSLQGGITYTHWA
jgi:serralysin